MPHPLPIFSQSDYLIQVVDTNSPSLWQIVQPDQLASSEANSSGSTLFVKTGYLIQVVDTNSPSLWQTVQPDQLASSEANSFGSTLFVKTGYIWVQQD